MTSLSSTAATRYGLGVILSSVASAATRAVRPSASISVSSPHTAGTPRAVAPHVMSLQPHGKAQRKEEILKSELPPTLPLMALRSTIVYPLGTIAVQMGAPENLALLRAHEEPG